MKYIFESYRFALEIIENPRFVAGLKVIKKVIKECPLYLYPNKSSNNKNLDVVQQLLNTYFAQRFFAHDWDYHPFATRIPNSDLKADFRVKINDPKKKKEKEGLTIQTEVQFGNMSRWYSDIFKFQTAYSQGLIDMGVSIVPVLSLARRIDSNVANFERCKRELPSAKLSITLPILLIGLDINATTRQFDVSKASIDFRSKSLPGRTRVENSYRIVHSIRTGIPVHKIRPSSPTGTMAKTASGKIESDED